MHYERLVIQADTNAFSLELHPRLTVIAGLDAVARESLIGELVGALGSSRPGVHLELVGDDGRRLAVFRPQGGRHRVVDVDNATDVSAEFRTPDGRIDVVQWAGADTTELRRMVRLTSTDLATGSRGAQLVRSLAEVDQRTLWEIAERVRQTDEELAAEAEALGSAPEDAAIIERVERRHEELESAQARLERLRHLSLWVGTVCAVGAAGAMWLDMLYGLPLLTAVVLAIVVSMAYRRRVGRAADEEQKALAEAGAQSYLGFHLQRVNGLLSSGEARKRFIGVADEHRAAVNRWKALTGDISVGWALEHREEIEAAARVRKNLTAMGAASATAADLADDNTADLAHVLVGRLTQLRRVGRRNESFPLILDDPFAGLDRALKPALLELLGHSAGMPQLIFLTNDEDVASWARLEALTGALSILEPTPEGASTANRRIDVEL